MVTALLKKWGMTVGEALVALFFIALLIFTRFYNLEMTARITQDEASDLVRMQEYFVQRKITLVGPISNDNSKVFGSLTYYMLMPFAALGNFDPIAPVYGTAFWGVLAAIFLVAAIWRINKKMVWMAAVFAIVWTPLVITSRWTWNPHYITFWIALGLFCYTFKNKWAFFLSGMFLSLAFHNHYLAALATGTFVGLVTIRQQLKKQFEKMIFLVVGYVLPIVPFVIFDLRHPPGLFFAKYLSGSDTPHLAELTIASFFAKLWENTLISLEYIVHPSVALSFLGAVLILLFIERGKWRTWLWFLPVVAQLTASTIIDYFQSRYFLPALPFLFVWLLLPRKGVAKLVALFCLVLAIFSSLGALRSELTETKVDPDIYSLREAKNYIASTVKENNLRNINVATLSSSDSEPIATKYRYLLQMQDVHSLAPSQYDTSEHLFVVSTADEATVRADKATAMVLFFYDSQLEEVHTIPNSDWKVYWFHY